MCYLIGTQWALKHSFYPYGQHPFVGETEILIALVHSVSYFNKFRTRNLFPLYSSMDTISSNVIFYQNCQISERRTLGLILSSIFQTCQIVKISWDLLKIQISRLLPGRVSCGNLGEGHWTVECILLFTMTWQSVEMLLVHSTALVFHIWRP